METKVLDKIFKKIEEIDAKHISTSYDEEDLLDLAKYAYKLALKDIKREVTRKRSYTPKSDEGYERAYAYSVVLSCINDFKELVDYDN